MIALSDGVKITPAGKPAASVWSERLTRLQEEMATVGLCSTLLSAESVACCDCGGRAALVWVPI
jgi:hypothetical protein